MTILEEINSWTGCRCSVYAVPMPEDTSTTSGKTPGRVIRIKDELWADYGAACEALGTNRSDDLRRHMVATVAAHQREQRRIARESSAD
jgi:hypothetical protein